MIPERKRHAVMTDDAALTLCRRVNPTLWETLEHMEHVTCIMCLRAARRYTHAQRSAPVALGGGKHND